MNEWKFTKEINIGHIFVGITFMLAAIGAHYSAASDRAVIKAEAALYRAQDKAESSRLSTNQEDILIEIKALRLDHNELNLEFKQHIARGGD